MTPHDSTEEISADEARLLALRAQGLLARVGADRDPPSPSDGGADVLAMLHQVSAVQLDTISVLARSHELVAYARLGPVGRKTVEQTYWGEPALTFEYLGHAGCIFPLEMWPYFAFRRRAMQRRLGEQLSGTGGASASRWRSVAVTFDEVRARLREGPVTASELGGARGDAGIWWNWSAAKTGIELLYRLGEVVCTTRKSWKRIYDLPERALPPDLLQRELSDEECFVYLVRRAAQALGVGTKRDIAAYFGLTTTWLGSPQNARRLLDTAIEACGLIPVRVEGWKEMAFLDPEVLGRDGAEEHRTTLLSPFDSLIWRGPVPPEGERSQRLFGFSLPFEPYVPRERRAHGYFSMALLVEGRLVGHVDPAREGRTLVARAVSLDDASAVDALAAALREAAAWVGCDAIRVERVEPPTAAIEIIRAIS